MELSGAVNSPSVIGADEQEIRHELMPAWLKVEKNVGSVQNSWKAVLFAHRVYFYIF